LSASLVVLTQFYSTLSVVRTVCFSFCDSNGFAYAVLTIEEQVGEIKIIADLYNLHDYGKSVIFNITAVKE